jgi:cyanoexosortase A
MPFAPVFATLGLGLMAVGFSGLRQLRKELFCLAFSWIPQVFIPGITMIDAKLAHYLLWYLGFNATRQGFTISLPQGAIEIYQACSSVALALVLLKLSIGICFIYQLPRPQQIQLLSIGVALAFGLNAIRLCILAIVVDEANEQAFAYWHGQAGSEIFSNGAILLLGAIFYWFFLCKSGNRYGL